MMAPIKPTKEQAKANAAKRKADLEKRAAQEKARTERFKNDPNAKNAVDYMTSSKGYQPDPLRARSGGTPKATVPKGTGKRTVKGNSRPKFR